MKIRRSVWLIVGGAACIVATLIFVIRSRAPEVVLPPLLHYAQLPETFSQALQRNRTRVLADPRNTDALRGLARLYHSNRLYDEARACYRIIAARSPGLSARDHYYLSDISQNAGDLETAQSELRLVLAEAPTYQPARLTLAETLFKSGRADEAAQVWTAIVATEPNQAQASLGLARFELQQGNDDAAVSRLERLIGAHLDCVSGAALLSQVLSRRGQAERAAALAEMSRRKHEPAPVDPWLDDLLADCYDSQRLTLRFEEMLYSGQLAAALPLLDRVEALDPKSWTPQLLRGWSLANGHHDREAVEQYRLALKKGGDPEQIVPLVVASMLVLDQVKEAFTFVAHHYAQNPDSTDILTAYADLAVRLGNDPLAKELLSKLLQKEPYLYRANMSLAKLLWSSSEHEQAVQCVQRIVKAFPSDVASRGLLAQHYLEHADPRSAISPLEQALSVAGNTPALERLTAMLESAYLQVGSADAIAGRFESAADYFAKASHLVPTQVEAFAGEANAATQLKQFRRAADALAKLAALQPDNPTIQLSLGDVLYQENEFSEARPHWARALQLAAANDSELRKALQDRLDGRISAETFR